MPLFLVATPIGHLADITQRAIACLKSCELILCEDTRTSLVLLRHHGIEGTLASFHKFNESSQQAHLLEKLQEGQAIALISDAGTPCLCDPGQELVQACRELAIEVIPLPGPSSVMAALCASGLKSTPFQFLGFAPKRGSPKRHFLQELLTYKGTSVFFESPERVQDTLQQLFGLEPSRKLALAKELSKKFETFFLGSAEELYTRLVKNLSSEESALLKGEWVIMVSEPVESKQTPAFELQPLIQKILELEAKGLSRRDSLLAASDLLGADTQALYKNLPPKSSD